MSQRTTVCGKPIPFHPEPIMPTESDRIALLILGRPDLTVSQKVFLRNLGSAERVEAALASLPRSTSTGDATTRASRLPAAESKELARRFGRGDRPLPHWDGNEFVLPQISPTQARTILARHAKDYGRDASVPMRSSARVDISVVGEIAASMAARGKVVES